MALALAVALGLLLGLASLAMAEVPIRTTAEERAAAADERATIDEVPWVSIEGWEGEFNWYQYEPCPPCNHEPQYKESGVLLANETYPDIKLFYRASVFRGGEIATGNASISYSAPDGHMLGAKSLSHVSHEPSATGRTPWVLHIDPDLEAWAIRFPPVDVRMYNVSYDTPIYRYTYYDLVPSVPSGKIENGMDLDPTSRTLSASITEPVDSYYGEGKATFEVTLTPTSWVRVTASKDTVKVGERVRFELKSYPGGDPVQAHWRSNFDGDPYEHFGIRYTPNFTDPGRKTVLAEAARSGAIAQYTIVVDDLPPLLTPLVPEPGSATGNRKPPVKARAKDNVTDLTKRNMKLFLDGRRIDTFSYDRDRNLLSYTPRAQLAYGRHTVKIEATDEAGNRAVESWRFRIVK